MSYPYKILFQSVVKPFYRENAGVFIFVFTIMFFVVGTVDGAGLIEYHRILITAMLENYGFLFFVFGAWLIYARKCMMFVSALLRQPEYSFIYIYNCLGKTRRFSLFLLVMVWLMLPVLLYSVFIFIVAWLYHFYLPLVLVADFLLLVCFFAAVWLVYVVSDLHNKSISQVSMLKRWPSVSSAYPIILLRFVAHRQKIIWAGFKLFTCTLLYLIFRNNTLSEADIHLTFLFFNFGVLGNTILIVRIRKFEEVYLGFYRGMPVSLWKRLLGYSIVYFVLLIPEFITTASLAPVHMEYSIAIQFSLCAYGSVLLLNNITFFQSFTSREYLPVLLLIIILQYIVMMAAGLAFLYPLLFTFAVLVFFSGYYKSERSIES